MTAPALPDVANRLASVTVLDRWALAAMLAGWGLLDPANLQDSYVTDVLPALMAALIAAQQEAARIGADQVDRTATAGGAPPTEQVRPSAFAGIASDGLPLQGLLVQPLIKMYVAGAAGVTAEQAVAGGVDLLERITVTQVHDAARGAEDVAMVANPEITGYVRVTESGACSRCILLSGKVYRWNSGFRRHPRCRCFRHVALYGDPVETSSPRELFDALSVKEQNRVFTNAGAESIRLGADIGRVVNARQGMTTATSKTGREMKATTNVFGQQLFTTTSLAGPKVPRPMPESLIALSSGDRELAVRLLRLHNYII